MANGYMGSEGLYAGGGYGIDAIDHIVFYMNIHVSFRFSLFCFLLWCF